VRKLAEELKNCLNAAQEKAEQAKADGNGK